jgi:hypothetical protein
VDLTHLRHQAIERNGGLCEICHHAAGRQLAHLHHRGRGGNPTGTRNRIDNVAWACVACHDMLDGRQPPTRRFLFDIIDRQPARPDHDCQWATCTQGADRPGPWCNYHLEIVLWANQPTRPFPNVRNELITAIAATLQGAPWT